MKLVIQLDYNQIKFAAGEVVEQIKLDSISALSQVFLTRLDRFIKKLGQQGIAIDGVAVNQTAPSFSGLRTVLIFVNLFARQHSWPLFDAVSGKKIRLAVPQYNHEPNITINNK